MMMKRGGAIAAFKRGWKIEGISDDARVILSRLGADKIIDVIDHSPTTLASLGVSFEDLYVLQAQVLALFRGKDVYDRHWTKKHVGDLMGRAISRNITNTFFPANVDQGTVNRSVQRATQGKHYKKPRRKKPF